MLSVYRYQLVHMILKVRDVGTRKEKMLHFIFRQCETLLIQALNSMPQIKILSPHLYYCDIEFRTKPHKSSFLRPPHQCDISISLALHLYCPVSKIAQSCRIIGSFVQWTSIHRGLDGVGPNMFYLGHLPAVRKRRKNIATPGP